jgi:uncharacterized protein (DUF2141 family)
MKNLLLSIWIVVSAFTVQNAQTENKDKKASLVIELQGVRNSNGILRIAIFEKNAGFPDNAEKAVKHISVHAQAGTKTVEINDLPYGEYAISLLHDENGNGKMDFNIFGIPVEGYGFSNNPRIILSAPSFNDSKFGVFSDTESIQVQVKY